MNTFLKLSFCLLLGASSLNTLAALDPNQQAAQNELRSRVSGGATTLNNLTGINMDPNRVHVYSGIEDTSVASQDIVNGIGFARERRLLGLTYWVRYEDPDQTTRTDDPALDTNDNGRWISQGDDPGGARNGDRCLIYLPSRVIDPAIYDPQEYSSTLWHELFHCYQYHQQFIVERQYTQRYGIWMIEGMAEWVGEFLVDGTDVGANRFTMFMDPMRFGRSIFRRDYDNLLFFHHVAQKSGNPLSLLARAKDWFIPSFSPLESGDQRIYEAIVQDGDPAKTRRTFPSGLWEKPEWADFDVMPADNPWDVSVPGTDLVTSQYRKENPIELPGETRDQTVTLAPQVPKLNLIKLTEANRFFRIQLQNARGTAKLLEVHERGVIDLDLEPAESFVVCQGTACNCADGAELDDVYKLIDGQTVVLADTAIPADIAIGSWSDVPSGGQIAIEEIQPPCCEETGGGVDPALHGRWQLAAADVRDAPYGTAFGSEIYNSNMCSRSGAGTAELEIFPDGTFRKTYGFTTSQTCRRTNPDATADFSVNGTVWGCMDTRAERNRNLYDLEITRIIDSANEIATGNSIGGPRQWINEPWYVSFGPDPNRTWTQDVVLRLEGAGMNKTLVQTRWLLGLGATPELRWRFISGPER